jgi:pentatricopeptide repeat protein
LNDTQGVTDALGNEGMTDAVVKLMREMDDEF